IYWIVVVPVRAPVPIAFIAACVPINDALLENLAKLSSFPQSVALATQNADGKWGVISKTAGYSPAVRISAPALLASPDSVITTEQQDDHLTMTARLTTAAT